MRRSVLGCFGLVVLTASAGCGDGNRAAAAPAVAPVSGTVEIEGLSAPVRVVRDEWGIPHIEAATTEDLFLAQGFVQASDRLFQMDLWRRGAQGRLAEVLGANFVSRDAMTRRVQYRGRLEEEWASYGTDARAIATAFVRGINAWVAAARDRPPEAFRLAGWLPEPWWPEDLLNRTDAFVSSGNALSEVFRSRLSMALGAGRASALLGGAAPSLGRPEVDPALISYQLGDSLRQIGTRPFFVALQRPADVRGVPLRPGDQGRGRGSNAWAIAGARSATGAPLLANDPHRLLAHPSLRYLVHLKAPGWNVIGATAPWLPGVAIGHNEHVAWGMTAADLDTADLYVEHLNPQNPHQIEVGGRWQNTVVVQDSLWVKGREGPVPFEREYTPHGVVVGVDRDRHLAFTLRWSGLEPGGAAELGALALARAESGADIRAALARWRAPVVEVLYAERTGLIGSQIAGRVPVRSGGDGRLPAAGWTGRARWTGWRGLDDLPNSSNPPSGYLASANQNMARTARLRTVLGGARSGFSVADSVRLQGDALAWNAERLVPLFARLRSSRSDVEEARRGLLAWNREVSAGSIEARTYVAWEQTAKRMLAESAVPEDLVDELVTHAGDFLVPALTAPSRLWFAAPVAASRDELMMQALAAAVDEVGARPDAPAGWAVSFAHPLAITEATRGRFNVGPFSRVPYADILRSTSGRLPDAAVGASFSAVFDTADWDRSVARAAPGQSEAPGSPHFADLARGWAEGATFSLAFSEAAVSKSAKSTLLLVPKK